MSWPMAIVWIVAIVAAAKVLSARYRANAGIIKDQHGNQQFVSKPDPAQEREIEELRERIKVLEKSPSRAAKPATWPIRSNSCATSDARLTYGKEQCP